MPCSRFTRLFLVHEGAFTLKLACFSSLYQVFLIDVMEKLRKQGTEKKVQAESEADSM